MGLSVTRALAELKLIQSKIEKTLCKKRVGVYQRKSSTVAGTALSLADFEKEAKANTQSIKDLLDRYQMLRKKLSYANSVNEVVVAGEKMTVAQAISFKDRVIPIMRMVALEISKEYANALNTAEASSARLDSQVKELLERNLGNDRSADKDAYEKIAEPFRKANEILVSDPGNIKDFAEELEAKISDFELEIDVALSEANSKYEIEID